MKKFLCLLMMFIAVNAAAQKDITKFLDIRIEGSKADMIQKLKEKGFLYDEANNRSEGILNGEKVWVRAITNENDEVWRILVQDATTTNKFNIKNRFNNFCKQFDNDNSYARGTTTDRTIPEEEDIAREMSENKKVYEAIYVQVPDSNLIDINAFQLKVLNILIERFTGDVILNPTEEQSQQIEEAAAEEVAKLIYEHMKNKRVWFKIYDDDNGGYYIVRYFDNET